MRHAQARNIIERIFGVIKKRWRILVVPPSYNMKIQARIPPALAALHNFIMKHDPEDGGEPDVLDDPTPGAARAVTGLHGELATERRTSMESDESKALRDRIADEMWAQYQEILEERGDEMDVDEDEEGDDNNGNQSGMEDLSDDDDIDM